MVYSGRPSTGCYLCRRRKIKCDEARPGCRNCEIYGKTCPGYRPQIVLQDKSHHTSRKWRSTLVAGNDAQHKSSDLSREHEHDALALTTKPRWLADVSMDDRALCYFFDQYTTQRTPDSLPGALESIPLLYVLCRENEVAGSPSSCLRWAVEAAALTSYANEAHDRHLAFQARQRYGLALQGLKEALSMPVEKMQDSTLATILLLVIFEDINGERTQLESSHTAGLELVARLHTYRRLDSKYSRCLFNFAYTQLQIQILGLGSQPKLDLHFLVDLFDRSDPLQSLMSIVTKLSQFVLDAPILLSCSNPVSNVQDLGLEYLANSLSRVQTLDEELGIWCRNVPDQWLPRVVYSTTGEALITCVSVSAATLWNFYRCSRVIVQTIIDNIYTRLDRLNEAVFTTTAYNTPDTIMNSPITNRTSASPSSSVLSQSTPYEIVQNMIVDICRSMPFTLGDVDSSGNPLNEKGAEHANTRIKAIEGYELLWPFWHVLTSHFSTPKQRLQAREGLYRLDGMGIKLASKMAGAVDLSSFT
ncbi:C6 transcription factor, putative [Talaromyces stipitatus ATCC 10500]|uniref:C6 transcription factor, putative n=1 Tax=Talaromyces stipitatus (strain ATCC 10500 / CBS 375.48 / QM 6759 / NRRL 1006) TaxID=441959 RepID=B8MLI8_TALSN|nr:C6 transcription factor, putative [Talaromyces stipitatus ATCC 10500]EED15521.1 C6 transcription factor, putative [Talaromyces stipitatus ATCC 10500]